MDKFASILPPRQHGGVDVRLWPGNKLGEFLISSAYAMLQGFTEMDIQKEWKKIWRLKVPERIRCFVWQFKHDRLFTNYHRSKWGIGDSFCPVCYVCIETTLHILRDCPVASSIWMHLVPKEFRNGFLCGDLQYWIHYNLLSHMGRDHVDD